MKNLIFFAAFFALQSLFSQSYQGLVYDKKNNMPVVFANIYTSQNSGVISNSEGYFKINLQNLRDNDSLSISSLGYKSQKISVSELVKLDTVFLSVQEEMLDEVVVSANKYTAEEIIEIFKDSIKVRHTITPVKFQIFSRGKDTYKPVKNGIELDKSSFMSRSKRKQFNEKVEAYFKKIEGNVSSSYRDMLYNAYYLKDSTAIEQIKETYLINQDKDNSMENIQKNVFKELIEALDVESTFKVKKSIITLEDSLSIKDFIVIDEPKKQDTIRNRYSQSPVTIVDKAQNLSNLEIFEDSKKYDFRLEDMSFFNGDIVYVISFEPGRNSAKYRGKAYINAEDFGLLKLDYQIIEGKKEAGVNLKFLLGVKYRVDNSKYQYIFRRNEDKTYIPIFYKSSKDQYVYFDVGFTFKENNDNRNERIKFKLSLYVESNSLSEREYLIINTEDIDPDNIEFDPDGYILEERIDKYDPNIWKDYNVIEATEEIKKYE
jgi:hypothetical protein